MPGWLSYLKKIKNSNNEAKLLVLGLDNSGKTTILKSISEEKIQNIKPTEGFNLKNLALDGVNLTVWDVGGQQKLREYWSNYFSHTNALIYVVDAADEDRLKESGNELYEILKSEDLKNIPVLIFANKQDLDIALEADEITEHMKLNEITNRQWSIVACSAITKEGLSEGLEWIVEQVRKK